jgi:recombination protein RecA
MTLAGARWGRVSALAPVALPVQPPAWALPDLTGRLVELSAGAEAAHLTAAFGLVLEAQMGRDRAAWVTLEHSSFFPPDALDSGIDLDAMPVVRVPDARIAGRAADHLLRSGGFGLVVIDLSSEAGSDRIGSAGPARTPAARRQPLPVPLLARLLGMARQHNAVVLLLTSKPDDAPSIHSLISLRAGAHRRPAGDGYEVGVRVIKDKRGGPGWTHVEICRGPDGLR